MLRKYVIIGSLNLLLAVGLGAFGAHGLKTLLTADQMATYQTAVHYHMIHALGILLVAILSQNLKSTRQVLWSARCLGIGILLFSGSLYVLSVSSIKFFGFITPIGGVAFLAGWLLLALAATRNS